MKLLGLAVLGAVFLFLSNLARPVESVTLPTIVLGHGWNTTSASMKPLADKFTTAGYTVHNLSLPGNDPQTNAQYICNYLAQNNLTNVAYIGHSMGGVSGRACAKLYGGLSRFSFVGMLDSSNIGVSGSQCILIPKLCATSSFMKSLNTAPVAPTGPFWYDIRLDPTKAIGGMCVFDIPGAYSLSAHMGLPARDDVFQWLKGAIERGTC